MDFQKVIKIAKEAGDEILKIYEREFEQFTKEDASPLTEADLAAHNVIQKSLLNLTPNIPILSEESAAVSWVERQQWQEYWLVDPLDGTKEFIKKNGEFTVNIALIRNGQPVWGVVYVPVTNVTYSGGTAVGNSTKEDAGVSEKLSVLPIKLEPAGWVIVGSRSHQSDKFIDFVAQFETPEIKSMGSSLKICLVAEGKADIYPRLGLTSEWDTAAAHAIVLGAGGIVIDAETQMPLTYNQKESVLNPFFIAANGSSPVWAR